MNDMDLCFIIMGLVLERVEYLGFYLVGKKKIEFILNRKEEKIFDES